MDTTSNPQPAGAGYKRAHFSNEFKRGLVEQSFEPGASVGLIARSNAINAKLLFKWRRHYLAGDYGVPRLSQSAAPKRKPAVPSLLPVDIIAQTAEPAPPITADAGASLESLCEVEFEHARLRIHGNVPPEMLRLLIGELSR